MIDQISGGLGASLQQAAGATESSRRKEGASAGSASNVEQLQLSDTAAQLRRIEDELKAMPVVDLARVDAVKAAINEGTYQIDNEAIASNLIRLDRAVFGD